MTREEAETIEAARAFAKAREDRERDDVDESPEDGSTFRHGIAAGLRFSPPCPYCLAFLEGEERLSRAVAALPFHWRPSS